ncbi:MAG: hypothetical protein NTV22_18705 [bacterium]|nr:hypothetical protein [bacterium]
MAWRAIGPWRNWRAARGVALVAVLSVLVVLALLAASLAVLMQIETVSARTNIGENQLYLLLDSSLAHAKALIYATQSAADGQLLPHDVLLDRFPARAPGDASPWINVYDRRGSLCGRYALSVEDEAAKVDLNSAFMLAPSPGSGWTPGELNLPLALGVPPQWAASLISYRYGRNNVPGARGDDDENNIFLMTDGIDNDADGVMDEDNEGIDDPGEYNAFAPCGDDRAFTGVAEALRVLRNSIGKMSVDQSIALRREIPRRASLYAIDFPTYASDGTPLVDDINVLTPRECRRTVGRANQRQPFGATQPQLNQLAANIVDYRDQNHVLSTLGGQYGVEAINFNEVLANDGTVAFNTAPATAGTSSTSDQELVVPHYCMWNHDGDAWQLDKSKWAFTAGGNYSPWDIQVLDKSRVRLLGPARKFTSPNSSSYFMETLRQQVYDRYMKMRRGTEYPPQSRLVERNGYSYTYESPTWPEDLFKNAYVILVQSPPNSLTASAGNSPRVQKVRASNRDGVLQLETAITFDYTTNLTRGLVFGWAGKGFAMCAQPRVPLMLSVATLQSHKYYLPIVNNWAEHRSPSRVARAGFGPVNTLSRDDRQPVDHKLTYGGDTPETSEPVRASGQGVINVFYSTGSDTTFSPALGFSGWNTMLGITFMRPEVLELLNVSPRAISLRGWTLTFNSGSVVNDVGIIDQGRGYSLRAGGPDANPSIAANGYFYLVNNTKLFNSEFGSGAPNINWGASAAQSVPVWEIPNNSWGVQYDIDKAVAVGSNPYDVRIYVKNEHFRQNHQGD